MKIENWPIEQVIPYKNNPRKNAAAIPAVMASIKEFGFRQPIVVDADGIIVVGDTRYKAAVKLGMPTVPVHVAQDLTPEQIRAYRLADNRTNENATWDKDLLVKEILALTADDYDLEMTAFSPDEISRMLNQTETEQTTREEFIPPIPKQPVSQPGKIYALGNHRLLVGDATDAEQIKRLTADRQMDLYLTDPPYNLEYVGKTKDALTIQNDKQDDQKFRAFLEAAFSAATATLRPGAAFYIWHADSEGFNFRAACKAAGLQVRQCLIWAKNTMVMGRQDYQWKHEPCLYGWKDGGSHSWFADRTQTTIPKAGAQWIINKTADGYAVTIGDQTYLITGKDLKVQRVDTTLLVFDRPTQSTDHPTMKPVKLFEYLMLNSTTRGQTVLDTFAGSGTTVIAAENLDRHAYVSELDPGYADVIRRRWAEFTTEGGGNCNWEAATPEVQ